MSNTNAVSRAPVWFISHGGPPTMFMPEHAAYKKWSAIGQEMRRLHKAGSLKGLVIVSAHWKAEDLSEGVYVNVDETNPLIYDFYNFPEHFYEAKFQSTNPSWLNKLVMSQLESKGIKAVSTRRGVDHGVWVPLKVAFAKPYPEESESGASDAAQDAALPSTLPLVQVSLPRSESLLDTLKLGRALRELRDQGYGIIGGGQAVHNLRDFGLRMMRGDLGSTDYSRGFTKALTEALVGPDVKVGNDTWNGDASKDAAEERWELALQLEKNVHFKGAHPTADHFLPTLLAFGASHNSEVGKLTFDLDEGPLAWHMYQWGEANL